MSDNIDALVTVQFKTTNLIDREGLADLEKKGISLLEVVADLIELDTVMGIHNPDYGFKVLDVEEA